MINITHYKIKNTSMVPGNIHFDMISSSDSKSVARIKLKNIYKLALNNDILKKYNKTNYEKIEKITLLIVEILMNEYIYNINMKKIHGHNLYTFYHSFKVSILSLIIGWNYGLEKKELIDLGLSALLHDIGKINIETHILEKPDKLTEKEWEQIKTHTSYKIDELKECSIPENILLGILDHHEKIDGTGYPRNLKGDNISLFGKIIAIADVYDALTSDRSYKSGISPKEGIEILKKSSGTHFDSELLDIFIKNILYTEEGTHSKLINRKF